MHPLTQLKKLVSLSVIHVPFSQSVSRPAISPSSQSAIRPPQKPSSQPSTQSTIHPPTHPCSQSIIHPTAQSTNQASTQLASHSPIHPSSQLLTLPSHTQSKNSLRNFRLLPLTSRRFLPLEVLSCGQIATGDPTFSVAPFT